MKILKCSDSSISSYRFCQFQYWLHYILGLEQETGKAANIGNILHKTFEYMARLKKRNKTNVDPFWLLGRSWDLFPHKDLRKFTTKGKSADYKKCEEMLGKILDDKYYSPYNLNVVDAEIWFELKFPGEEWEVEENGIKKQFKTRGYIDLIHEIDKDTIEIVDYKSGARKTPFSSIEMDFYGLIKKLQGQLYYLAIRELYPQYKHIIITFYFLNDNGPTTIGFSDDDIPKILSRLYASFKTIEKDSLIKRNRSWRCKMCGFNKNDLCGKIWSDLNTMGENYTINKYYKINLKEL